MIVVDTSALAAILKVKPDAAELLRWMGHSRTNRIATSTLLEAQMAVTSKLGDPGLEELKLMLSRAQSQFLPFHSDHLHWALLGWRHYGRERHKAELKLGDCFSYGLAKTPDAPLLFKGEDFHYTDVKVAR